MVPCLLPNFSIYIYRVYKKTEQIWNCSQFRKTARGITFLLHIDSLSTMNNVKNEKKILELNFVNQGGFVFWVNGWKICWVFNYCTKFQTICFRLSPLTIHFSLKNQPFACLITPLPNLHIADIYKLGKGIIKHAKGGFCRKM
jgi:hypothetical protein